MVAIGYEAGGGAVREAGYLPALRGDRFVGGYSVDQGADHLVDSASTDWAALATTLCRVVAGDAVRNRCSRVWTTSVSADVRPRTF